MPPIKSLQRKLIKYNKVESKYKTTFEQLDTLKKTWLQQNRVYCHFNKFCHNSLYFC